jgi:PAS domain S-box-containing protein
VESLKILLLEDNENDAELIQKEIVLNLKYDVIFKWVVTKNDYISALEEFKPDIILSDYNLPQLTGFYALEIALRKNSLVPFITVTGTLSEEIAASSIIRGAWDYIVKERLNRLPRAIENVLKLKIEKEKLYKAEEEIKIVKQQTGIQIKLLYEAINHAPSSVTIINSSGNIIYTNPKFSEITGFSNEEVVGKSTHLLKSEKEENKILTGIWATLGAGKEWSGEIQNKKKDGENYWAHINASPIKDDEGKITHYVIIEHDVSDLKQKEHDLRESENMYRALFNSTGAATCIIEDDGTIALVNPKFEELCGYTRDELEGKMKYREFIDEQDYKRMGEYREEKLKSRIAGVTHYQFLLKDKKGNRKTILLSIDFIKDSNKSIASHLDLTEQLKAKATLEAERILLKTVIDNLPDAIYVKDKLLRKILVNKADLENIGKPEEKVIGKSDFDLFPSEIAAQTVKDDEAVVMEGKTILNKEEFIINSKGRKVWVLTSKLPLRDKDGDITGLVGIGRDITNSKKMVGELIEAKNKAEEMNRLKTIFLANMSHELRTPLVGLLGFSELLQSELTGEQKEYADFIYKSGERLLRTLSSLLNYSKIEAEKATVYLLSIPLVELLKDEIKLYSAAAKNKGLKIISEFSVNQLSINSDEKLLREIVDNILNNAIKFTFKGSIHIKLTVEDQMVVIAIKDTGIGISKNDIGIIFEEFRQVSEGDNRNYQGSGLGLTLVKRYIKLLNGDIKVESEIGAGSTFTIRLPLDIGGIKKEGTYTAGIQQKSGETVSANKKNIKKILLVEDEMINQLTIKRMLTPIYEVDCCGNSNDALEAVKSNVYDVVLMDINLGAGLNGIETIAEIKKDPSYFTKPMVAITAYAMDSDREEFLRSGCTHYIAKPFKRQELLDLLDDINKQ